MKDKRISFDISQDLHSRLKVKCAKSGVSIKDYITMLIKNELDKRG
jgi:predicted DNA binding CopG/RHH family protein